VSRRAVPDVVYSTMGQSGPSRLTLGKPYRWRGVEGWTGGDLRFSEPEPRRPGPPPGTRNSAEDKARRFAVFCAAIADGKSVLDAGIAAGIGAETAKKYDRERRKQQQGESRDA